MKRKTTRENDKQQDWRKSFAGAVFVALWACDAFCQDSALVIPDDAIPYWKTIELCRTADQAAVALKYFSIEFYDSSLEAILSETDQEIRNSLIESLHDQLLICQNLSDIQSVEFKVVRREPQLAVTFYYGQDDLDACLFVFVDDPLRGPLIKRWAYNFSPESVDTFEPD
ncbi:MAG: hypothetical protein AAFM91_15160 [Pseudomonadota bacterium]